MKLPRGNNTIYFIFLILLSCRPGSEEGPRPYEFLPDFKKEVLRLEDENPRVEKTVTKNGNTETITDTINWENELALFIGADINKPRFKNSYTVAKEETSGNSIITCSAKDMDLPVKSVRIKMAGGSISEIYFMKEVDNFITKSHFELYYYPGKGYSISARQSMAFFYDEEYKIEGKFVSAGEGRWRGVLRLETGDSTDEIPFGFSMKYHEGNHAVEIMNASEKIICRDVKTKGDSIFIRLPVFDSEIKGKLVSGHFISGAWYNYSKGSDYAIPFFAEYGKEYRFYDSSDVVDSGKQYNVTGKWEAVFSPGTKGFYKAIGVFEQKGRIVTGTFLTETGDYRFLEGCLYRDTLFLSSFDGSHAFLFKAALKPDDKKGLVLDGTFFSGSHWKEPWVAEKNEMAKLADPDSLTFLKPGFEKLAFSFPDLAGNQVSLSDERFVNKVVIIQILGSWCPNCLDETVYLSELYNEKHGQGLEIVGLSFERSADFHVAKLAVKRFMEQLNAPYDFLIAGTAGTANAHKALPMLNHIMSFPTSIFIDRRGKVRKIHTGFYGPGTGEYYTKFKSETKQFVESLLTE